MSQQAPHQHSGGVMWFESPVDRVLLSPGRSSRASVPRQALCPAHRRCCATAYRPASRRAGALETPPAGQSGASGSHRSHDRFYVLCRVRARLRFGDPAIVRLGRCRRRSGSAQRQTFAGGGGF